MMAYAVVVMSFMREMLESSGYPLEVSEQNCDRSFHTGFLY